MQPSIGCDASLCNRIRVSNQMSTTMTTVPMDVYEPVKPSTPVRDASASRTGQTTWQVQPGARMPQTSSYASQTLTPRINAATCRMSRERARLQKQIADLDAQREKLMDHVDYLDDRLERMTERLAERRAAMPTWRRIPWGKAIASSAALAVVTIPLWLTPFVRTSMEIWLGMWW